jgi:type IV pilus assembly protein PilW
MRQDSSLPTLRSTESGFTLIELMISVLLGLMVMGTASVIYLGNRGTTTAQRDLAELSQSGSLATDIVARMFRQAGHVAIGGTTGGSEGGVAGTFCSLSTIPSAAPLASTPAEGGFMEGWDAKTVPGNTVVNNSDIVLLRFDGSSQRAVPSKADGSIVDCLGAPVAGPTPGSTSERSWAKLYVSVDTTTNNPALYCSYRNSATASDNVQPLIDNVESFQILYGLGALYSWDGTTKLTEKADRYRIVVEKYVPAAQLTSAADWNNVAAVRFGVVVAGDSASRGAVDSRTDYDVLGPGYGAGNGAQFDASTLSADRKSRMRKTIAATVELRNAPIYTGCNAS